MSDVLYIVVPCYNEEEVLPETARRLKEKLTTLTEAGKISQRGLLSPLGTGTHEEEVGARQIAGLTGNHGLHRHGVARFRENQKNDTYDTDRKK